MLWQRSPDRDISGPLAIGAREFLRIVFDTRLHDYRNEMRKLEAIPISEKQDGMGIPSGISGIRRRGVYRVVDVPQEGKGRSSRPAAG